MFRRFKSCRFRHFEKQLFCSPFLALERIILTNTEYGCVL